MSEYKCREFDGTMDTVTYTSMIFNPNNVLYSTLLNGELFSFTGNFKDATVIGMMKSEKYYRGKDESN